MTFAFAEPKLEALDELDNRCLVLTFFADDRPLRGLTGRVDWRLCGQLSRLMISDFVDGHFCEAMLTPLGGRLPFERLLLVGMGRRSDFGPERFEEICRFCFGALARMGVNDFAMSLPGRVGLDVGLRQALRGWRSALIETFEPEALGGLRVCILEAADVQRELVEPMRDLERELQDRAVGDEGRTDAHGDRDEAGAGAEALESPT